MSRRKKELTPEQWEEIGEYAFNGCQNKTIAGLMDWPDGFIEHNKIISKFLTKKRQERKLWLLSQNKRIIESNQLGAAASTLIFTEKQSEHMGGLGFTDRPEDKSRTERPLVLIIGGDQQVKMVESHEKQPEKLPENDR